MRPMLAAGYLLGVLDLAASLGGAATGRARAGRLRDPPPDRVDRAVITLGRHGPLSRGLHRRDGIAARAGQYRGACADRLLRAQPGTHTRGEHSREHHARHADLHAQGGGEGPARERAAASRADPARGGLEKRRNEARDRGARDDRAGGHPGSWSRSPPTCPARGSSPSAFVFVTLLVLGLLALLSHYELPVPFAKRVAPWLAGGWARADGGSGQGGGRQRRGTVRHARVGCPPMLVLHASPHPDDELVGAPATLMALRDAGHEVVNVACSLGRPEDAAQRRAEVEEACGRARFELVVLDHPLSPAPRGPAPERDEARATAGGRPPAAVRRALPGAGRRPVAARPPPRARDRRARARLRPRGGPGPERLWMWGLWGELPFPTTIVEYGERTARGDPPRARGAREPARPQRLPPPGGGPRQRRDRPRGGARLRLRWATGWRAPTSRPRPRRCAGRPAGGSARRGGSTPSDPFPEPVGPDIGWWLRARSAADGLALASG